MYAFAVLNNEYKITKLLITQKSNLMHLSGAHKEFVCRNVNLHACLLFGLIPDAPLDM